MKFLSLVLSLFLATLPPGAGAAGKAGAAKSAPTDITTPSQKLVATCPAPKAGPCVLDNPIEESRWRVLTPNVEIEPVANGWLVDFSKVWKDGTQKITLRVMSGSGSVREIEVGFRK